MTVLTPSKEWQNHPADVNLPLTADMYVHVCPFRSLPVANEHILVSTNRSRSGHRLPRLYYNEMEDSIYPGLRRTENHNVAVHGVSETQSSTRDEHPEGTD